MGISKAERILDLVIALLNAERAKPAAWIHRNVAGYGDAPSEEAFLRTFERDKQELRDMGIAVETDASGERYRITPARVELPEMTFTPAESAALAVASRLWETTALREAGTAAVRKLREAAGSAADATDDAPAGQSAVLARIHTAEPAFVDLFAALRARRAVRFDYRAARQADAAERTVEPWGLMNFRGSWYLVGHDRDRNAPRTFRLSRIVGEVRAFGRSGSVQVPESVSLRSYVTTAAGNDDGDDVALLRVRSGAAAGLRRRGTVIPALPDPHREGSLDDGADAFDEIRLPYTSISDLAGRVAGHGPDVVVVDPPELRAEVIALLRGSVASAGAPSAEKECP